MRRAELTRDPGAAGKHYLKHIRAEPLVPRGEADGLPITAVHGAGQLGHAPSGDAVCAAPLPVLVGSDAVDAYFGESLTRRAVFTKSLFDDAEKAVVAPHRVCLRRYVPVAPGRLEFVPAGGDLAGRAADVA